MAATAQCSVVAAWQLSRHAAIAQCSVVAAFQLSRDGVAATMRHEGGRQTGPTAARGMPVRVTLPALCLDSRQARRRVDAVLAAAAVALAPPDADARAGSLERTGRGT